MQTVAGAENQIYPGITIYGSKPSKPAPPPLQQKPNQLEVCICSFQTTNRGTSIFHKTKQKQKAKQNVMSVQAIETAKELFGHKMWISCEKKANI